MSDMLRFIGIGSAFNSKMGNTSAFIKIDSGKHLVLFDCGEDVFKRVKRSNLLNGVKKVDIFITHNHSDHIGSLGTMLAYLFYVLDIKANVYDIKPASSLRKVLDYTGVLRNIYTFNKGLEGGRVDIDKNLSISGFKVKHYDTIESTAYEIMYNNKLILYTGDCSDANIFADSQITDLYDVIYTDCSCNKFTGNPHLFLGDLKVIPLGIRNKVFCMHIESYEAVLQIQKAGFSVVEIDPEIRE